LPGRGRGARHPRRPGALRRGGGARLRAGLPPPRPRRRSALHRPRRDQPRALRDEAAAARRGRRSAAGARGGAAARRRGGGPRRPRRPGRPPVAAVNLDAVAAEALPGVRLLPVVHDRIELAAVARAVLDAWDPEAVAVELPTTLAAAAERAVARLPRI